MTKVSKHEKIEGILLIIFIIAEILFYQFKCSDWIVVFASLMVITLLILWLKNAKTYIQKNDRRKYNIAMFIFSIYAKSASLVACSFGLAELPFNQEIKLVAKASLLIYIIISLINREYRNSLWGFVYKVLSL
ncbi:MAG: hypothetical protein Q4Q06_04210 [Bacteroidota bacterium]|nr:hypothetical protein [Bacteroidota bacterium]